MCLFTSALRASVNHISRRCLKITYTNFKGMLYTSSISILLVRISNSHVYLCIVGRENKETLEYKVRLAVLEKRSALSLLYLLNK
jgi:ribosomal protein L18